MKIQELVIVSLLSICVSCQIVLDTKELSVDIGRSVYLKRDDIRFSQTEKGDECRIEVVRNDPITQRVGYVEPHVSTLSNIPFPPNITSPSLIKLNLSMYNRTHFPFLLNFDLTHVTMYKYSMWQRKHPLNDKLNIIWCW